MNLLRLITKLSNAVTLKKGNWNADTIPYKSSNWHKNRSVKIYVVYFQMFFFLWIIITKWLFLSSPHLKIGIDFVWFLMPPLHSISISPAVHNNWKQASFITFSIWNLQKNKFKGVDYIEFLECCNNALSLSFFQKTIINFRRIQKKTFIITPSVLEWHKR